MTSVSSGFILHSQLQKDTVFIANLELSELRLMDDQRWPWLILVPKLPHITEIYHLTEEHQQQLCREISHIASLLKEDTTCDKINIATLGNIVSQLHIHIVARSVNDPNWPHPVWGEGSKQPYSEQQKLSFIKRFSAKFLM